MKKTKSVNNLVKKHMEEFNRPSTEKDKKKEEKKNPSFLKELKNVTD